MICCALQWPRATARRHSSRRRRSITSFNHCRAITAGGCVERCANCSPSNHARRDSLCQCRPQHLATTLPIRVVRNIDFWRGNYRDKDMPRYDVSITIFDTIRYIVPSLIIFTEDVRWCPCCLPRQSSKESHTKQPIKQASKYQHLYRRAKFETNQFLRQTIKFRWTVLLKSRHQSNNLPQMWP